MMRRKLRNLWWWSRWRAMKYRLRYVLKGDCGHECDWVQPFGWVPEDGCPVHDVKGAKMENSAIYAQTDHGFVKVGELHYVD